MENKMRAAVYARVSTAAQDPEPQLAALRRYVASCDWTLAGEYVDQASGADGERPNLTRLMRDAFDRKFGAIVVWKFDRFGRSVSQLLRSLEEFDHLGIQFVSMQEKIDTGSPLGKVIFTVLGALAEFERSMIRERILIGQAAARARGVHLGRPTANFDGAAIRADYVALKSLRKTAERHRCSQATVFAMVHDRQLDRAK